MREGPDIAAIASLIGDPARANMLSALMGGEALTARELAAEAGVTPQTASAHIAKLETGGLVAVRKQGRHRYVALADDRVGAALESLMGLAAAQGRRRTRPGPRDPEMRIARVCYDHLAGEMGVRLFDSLSARGGLDVGDDGVRLTRTGRDIVATCGVDLDAVERKRAPHCRICLDWSARRSHLAGPFGAALLRAVLDRGWAIRVPDSRIVRFSVDGETAFREAFPL